MSYTSIMNEDLDPQYKLLPGLWIQIDFNLYQDLIQYFRQCWGDGVSTAASFCWSKSQNLWGLSWGCGGSVDIALTSNFRLPMQQFWDQIWQPSQSLEQAQDKRLLGSFIEVGLSRGYSYTQWPLGKPWENPWGSGIIPLGPLLLSMKPGLCIKHKSRVGRHHY
jgi:hypothetical protein